MGMLSAGLLQVCPAADADGAAASRALLGFPQGTLSPYGQSAPKSRNAAFPALPKEIASAVSQGDFHQVEQETVRQLKLVKDINPHDMKALQLSMLLEVVRVTSPEVLTDFAKDPKRLAFLESFLSDPGWQELYLGAGLVPFRNTRGMEVLFRIWETEKGQVKNKKLAVALASVWGGGEASPNPPITKKNPARYNPVWRYQFFQKQAEEGRLHPNYENLQPWELRFVVGIPGQDWDDGSYAWAAQNINLPWDMYQQACWAAIYTDPSKFGDSVQCGAYNLPFSDVSWGEATQLNGGVCGALSHLGAVAAMAHGIPAYTVGQPGHCAYGVRPVRGQWVGGFGGPDGGMHNSIFGDRAPTSYLLMEEVFKDDDAIARAYRWSFCARACEAAYGKTDAAVRAWEAALRESPLHPFFRKELHRLMMEKGLSPEGACKYLSQVIPLYRGNGFAAVDMAKDLEPLIKQMDDLQKAGIFSLMHEAIASTPSSWAVKCDDVLQAQSDAFASEQARQQFLVSLLAIHMHKGDGVVFGQVLEWAVKEYVEKGKEDLFGAAFAQAAQSAPSLPGKVDDERMKKMQEAYGKAIVAAEQARSVSAFQVLSQAAENSCGPCPAATPLTKGGNLKGSPAVAAMIRLSSTSRWDSPAWHRSMTTPMGGKSHTDKEEKPFYVVELPAQAQLTGCVVRKADGNEGRMKKAVVYTSEDGATWKPRVETPDMPKEWEAAFPEGTRGKWVKVEFDQSGAPEFTHLSHIVVYTK